jgi:hypothetical protein
VDHAPLGAEIIRAAPCATDTFLRGTTSRLIDESRQLRAQSEKLIDQSQRLRRRLHQLAERHRETTAPVRLVA